MHDELVQIKQLTKSFREGESERVVFHDLSASVKRGEFVVLLGRSGSGKSTLLNLVSGIDLPNAGEVVVAGQSMSRLSEQKRTLFRRQHVGFVFQFYNLISTLTVKENLLLPLELTGEKETTANKKAQTLLEQVELADRGDSYPDRLSGGEQQRVAICRALVHRPLLLLADEPTGNLDAETGQKVLALLGSLARENGTTTLMATHSRDVARRADRVLTIRDGRLLDAGLEPVDSS